MSFKNLEPEDILISKFEVHKTFTVSNVDSSSGVYALPITKGTDTTQYGWNTDESASKTISSSVFYSIPNYYVINNLFRNKVVLIRRDIFLIIIYQLRTLVLTY